MLDTLLGVAARRRTKKREKASRNSPHHRRMAFEPLEDRRLLSTTYPSGVFNFVAEGNYSGTAEVKDIFTITVDYQGACVLEATATYASTSMGTWEASARGSGVATWTLFGAPSRYEYVFGGKGTASDTNGNLLVTAWTDNVEDVEFAISPFFEGATGRVDWATGQVIYTWVDMPIELEVDGSRVEGLASGRWEGQITVLPDIAIASRGDLPVKSSMASNLVLVTHGWYATSLAAPHIGNWWLTDMANEIADFLRVTDQADQWDVWMYDWREHSCSVEPLSAASRAYDLHGPPLGATLATSDYRYDHVHFIGHSAGSWVIDQAARTLANRWSQTTIHTTYLDAYQEVRPSVLRNPGAAADWAEHYYTASTLVGSPSANARNFDVAALRESPTSHPVRHHAWPHEWYLNSVRAAVNLAQDGYQDSYWIDPFHQGVGFFTSVEFRNVLSNVSKPLLNHNDSLPLHDNLKRSRNTVLSRVVNSSFSAGTLDGWEASGSGTVTTVQTDSGEYRASLVSASPVTLGQGVFVPSEPFRLDFEYEFLTTTGMLQVTLDSVALATFEAPANLLGSPVLYTVTSDNPGLMGAQGAPLQFTLDGPTGTRLMLRGMALTPADVTPPTAQLIAFEEQAPEWQEFTIRYTDNEAVDTSSIIDNHTAVLVVGPGGFAQHAHYIAIDDASDGPVREVTYRVMAPDERWGQVHTGDYTVFLLEGAVGDKTGLFADTTVLGTFQVAAGNGDRFEPNDTLETATDLGTIASVRSESNLSIHHSDDIDWYRFVLTDPGDAKSKIEVRFGHADGHTTVDLYRDPPADWDSSSMDRPWEIASGISMPDRNVILSLDGVDAGEYYLVINHPQWAMSTNTYSLHITPAVVSNRFEPNNTKDTATDLGTITSIRSESNLSVHHSDDIDWYRFVLASPGDANSKIEVIFEYADGNTTVDLYRDPPHDWDPSSVDRPWEIAGGITMPYREVVLSLDGVDAGEYYLVINHPQWAVSANTYSFRITPPADSGQALVGVYRSGTFYLDVDGDGRWNSAVDRWFRFGNPDDTPLIGDWNGDGRDQIGVWRNGVFYFDISGDGRWNPGAGDYWTRFGNPTDTPIVGDWNGDGRDQIGVWRNGVFYFDVSGDGRWNPAADQWFRFGSPGDTPIVGDWNGDGKDQIGVWRDGAFYFDFSGDGRWNPGAGDYWTRFGNPTDTPIIGDWNGDGIDHIGVWRTGTFYFDYSGDGRWNPGAGDYSVRFGNATDTPVIGAWAGPVGGQALHAAGLPADTAAAGPALDDDALSPLVFAAIADWTTLLDLGAGQRNPLYDVRFVIADLPGTMLGLAERNTVYLDARAAGHGWFLDPTPAIDEEFEPVGSGGELRAVDSALAERMDLLTVVSHELGHVLGLADLDPPAGGLMGGRLQPGQRYRPGAAEREAYFAALV